MHGIASKHSHPSNHITPGHAVEYSLHILNTPTFGIHVNEANTHKEIRLQTDLDDLSVDMPALFK